ncbi:GspH/FimT family pseudopilin [Pseudomonas putida]|uniref:Type II secretion system protein H n=1 Tax=Pseudomonas putida TaxID=303 RepID=A0A1L7N747_PSEPU|nr:GspH/FimT family pseudopilin [Pseudomonas putida]MDN5674380.1 GspH/FimT family pseudopilin [Pseudomonas sp.]KAF0251401.1 type IV pili biogenesis protein FimT [Pseudomonas putida]MBH3351456.1 GspH/FimT family pseudopilin [Pseudomonas putida]MBS5847037.1 GspH/FimT family pseudopilin [Pseudomonas putida]MCE0878514.1 GspH/FimT family pseudopilin [Pseudomonas putida]
MKQRGVTLIQMLSALAIAVLLTQLGMPAYARMSNDLHRAAAARDLAQALRSARSHAMLQSQPVLVQALDGNWGNGWRVMLEHNQQLLREQRLSRPLKITSNRGEQFKFSALGVPMTLNNSWLGTTLEVCERSSASSRYQVVLASTGRVRLLAEDRNNTRCAST